MDSKKLIEVCKYYNHGHCPYKAEYARIVDGIIERGEDVGGLQPRCPRDAQKTKRGVFACHCERGKRLC